MPMTATMAANTLPFSTLSWLMLEPEELEPLPELLLEPPCEKPVPPPLELLPEEEVEPGLAALADPSGLLPGLPPLKPGIVAGLVGWLEPDVDPEAEDAEDESPAFMFRPVPCRDLRTVGLSPSTTVSLVPAMLLDRKSVV